MRKQLYCEYQVTFRHQNKRKSSCNPFLCYKAVLKIQIFHISSTTTQLTSAPSNLSHPNASDKDELSIGKPKRGKT
ncbi:hypothetical protein JTE90_001149 [Oedothorax gibbosus]|uniref:Uncharacterized protein n=1 Tax=Oedothorax gibbosus TaxID=931172 RepID=A0AAV6VGI8_9ARAC|nr:hypothetical protein JTE90_001149 [Oedothorax gibbosus]